MPAARSTPTSTSPVAASPTAGSPSARELAARTPASRDRSVDALRVASLAVVMVGHTLMATVGPDGRIGNVLAVLPEAQIATWLFQVVPVFFLVGGFGHAAAWRRRADGAHPGYGEFVATRARRLVPPAALLCAVWLGVGALLDLADADRGLPRAAARVAVQPLWFLGVYLGVVALTPVMLALHRRFGLGVVGVLAVATALLDVVRFSSPEVPPLAYASTATVWLAVHSLGFALFDGTLERAGRWLAGGGLVSAAALVAFGPYPLSMVGLPGAPTSNMGPPTLALLAHAVWLTGLVVLVRPRLRAVLQGERAWTEIVAANGVTMTAFLWHLTALFGVLAVGPRPVAGSPIWWITRPLVVLATLIGTGLLVALLRRAEGSDPLPSRSTPMAAAGVVLAAGGLLALSATGAAGVLGGRTASLAGLEVTPAAGAGVLLAGCLLLGVRPGRRRVGAGHVAERP